MSLFPFNIALILYSHMLQLYTYTCKIITTQWIKTSEDFFKKIYLSLYCKGFEKGYSRFYCERELQTEQNCNILTPTLMAISVVSFLFSWCPTGGPRAHSAGFLYYILSPTSLVPNSQLGVPKAPSARLWLSLPHLGSNSKLNWLPVFTELYNSSIAHSISPHDWPSGCVTSTVFGMACFIVIERK